MSLQKLSCSMTSSPSRLCVYVSRSVMSDSLQPHGSPPASSLFMEFSRQEYWSGLPFPSPKNLPNPGIKPKSAALQADSLPSEPLCLSIADRYGCVSLNPESLGTLRPHRDAEMGECPEQPPHFSREDPRQLSLTCNQFLFLMHCPRGFLAQLSFWFHSFFPSLPFIVLSLPPGSDTGEIVSSGAGPSRFQVIGTETPCGSRVPHSFPSQQEAAGLKWLHCLLSKS